MNETTRITIWSILNESFNLILKSIRNTKPDAKMNSGHHHNEAFLFRAYAEYSDGGPTVVISFDMQEKGTHRTRFSGDIAMENGVILKEVMETSAENDKEDETTFIKYAKEFSLACQKYTTLIVGNLKELNAKDEPEPINLETIKPEVTIHGEIVCIDDSGRCSILVDGKLLSTKTLQELLNRHEGFDIQLTIIDPSDR